MSHIVKKVCKPHRRRYVAWILVLITIFISINPTAFIYADADRGRDWDVEYYFEADGESPISKEGYEYRLAVKKGADVNFNMQLSTGQTITSRRFKETFEIEMPDEIYDLFTENGYTPQEGFLASDVTESGYLLEEGDREPDLATTSDVSRSHATAGNAVRSSSMGGQTVRNHATGSNSKTGFHKLTFQFVSDLREAEAPAEITIEAVTGVLSFVAPADMVLVLEQTGNHCRITLEPESPGSSAPSLETVKLGLSIKKGLEQYSDAAVWNPDDYLSGETITLRVNYHSETLQEYPADQLQITIDGLTGQLSEYWASLRTAPEYEPHYFVRADAWNYSYDEERHQFIFSNKEPIAADTNFAGYFEIAWAVSGRMKAGEYVFQAVLSDGTGEQVSPECTFRMEKDTRMDGSFYKYAINANGAEMKSIYHQLPEQRDNYYWAKYHLRLSFNQTNKDTMLAAYRIVDPIPEGCIVLDSEFNEVQLSADNEYIQEVSTLGNTNAFHTVTSVIYVGYPEQLYKDDPSAENTFKVYGKYEDSDADPEYLGEDSCFVSLVKYDFNYSGKDYAIDKNVGPNSQTILNQVRYHQAKERDLETIYTISPFAIHTGEAMELVIGDDLLYITRKDGRLTRLTDTEYYFRSLKFPAFGNGSGKTFTGKAYTLKVQKAGNAEYETFKTGTLQDNQTITFKPEDKVLRWQLTLHDIDDDLQTGDITTTVDVAAENIAPGGLHNFTYLQVYTDGALRNEPDESSYEGKIVKDEISAYDQAVYGHYLQRDAAEIKLIETDSKYIGAAKVVGSLDHWPDEEQYGITYQLRAYTYFDSDVWDDDYLSTISMYDILPPGVYLNQYYNEVRYLRSGWRRVPLSHIRLKDGKMFDSYEALDEYLLDHTTIDFDYNYQGSGRTKVTIKLDLSDNQLSLNDLAEAALKDPNFNQPYVYYMDADIKAVVPYASLDTYGREINNQLYIEATSESATGKGLKYRQPVADDGAKDALAADINQNGDKNDYLDMASVNRTILYAGSSHQELLKAVRTSETKGQFMTGAVQAAPGEAYTYQLKTCTDENPVSSLVFYDTIETVPGHEGFQGSLLGFNTSYADSLGFKPVIYYSDSSVPGSLIRTPQDWKLYRAGETDLAEVKSVAFDFRLDSDGREAVIPANTVLYVEILMKAPDAAPDTSAKNQFSVEWRLMDGSQNSNEEVTGLSSNVVEVMLKENRFVPFRLFLRKLGERGWPLTSDTASFAVFYDAACKDAVMDGENELVITTTLPTGTAETVLHLDPQKRRSDGTYQIFMKETKTPEGYWLLGGKHGNPDSEYIMKMTIKQDLSGSYELVYSGVDDIYHTITTGEGVNQLSVYNYPMVPRRPFGLYKRLLDVDGSRVMEDIPEFQFELKVDKAATEKLGGDVTGVELPEGAGSMIVTNHADGLIMFQDINYLKAGVYVFAVTERDQTNAGIIYDQAMVRVVMEVVEKDGILYDSISDYEKSDYVEGEYDNTFVNQINSDYIPETDLKLTKKLLNAGAAEDEELPLEHAYRFFIRQIAGDTEAVMIPESYRLDGVVNTAAGEIEFPGIRFYQEGVCQFEITEELPVSLHPNHTLRSYDPGRIIATVTAAKIGHVLTVTDVRYEKLLEAGQEHYFDRDESQKNHTFINFLKPASKPQPEEHWITMKKVSYSADKPLAGAQFTAAYREAGSSAGWQPYGGVLETAGEHGEVQLKLPENCHHYEYRLVESKAPSGYSKSRVGIITFTVTEDGAIAAWSSTGTQGYVELAADRLTLVVKNHTIGGSSNGNNSGDGDSGSKRPTNPESSAAAADPTESAAAVEPESPVYPTIAAPGTPMVPYHPGDSIPEGKQVVTVIDPDGVPRTYLVDIQDASVPQHGLARTGDTAASALLLVVIMLVAAAGFGGIVLMRRRRNETESQEDR